MKTFRAFFCSYLLIAAVLASAGCASTSTDSKATGTYLTKSDKRWDDLSQAEKAGNVLWWPFQNALLAGGEALGGH